MTAKISSSALNFRPAVIAMLSVGCCIAHGSTVREGKIGPFYTRSEVWKVEDLTEPNLRLYYQQLSQELKGYRAWTVEVFIDQDDARRELHGKLRTEENYDWWLKLYNEFGSKLLPKAEFLTYENNGVLRLRDGAGTLSETVLSGDNFLRIRNTDIEFDILETYFSGLPPHTKSALGDEAMIWVYVRASSFPSVRQARQFSLIMRKRYQEKRIVVHIRTDSYFITDGRFPIVYRFDPDRVPPSREQYEQSKTMYCFCDRPGILCR